MAGGFFFGVWLSRPGKSSFHVDIYSRQGLRKERLLTWIYRNFRYLGPGYAEGFYISKPGYHEPFGICQINLLSVIKNNRFKTKG